MKDDEDDEDNVLHISRKQLTIEAMRLTDAICDLFAGRTRAAIAMSLVAITKQLEETCPEDMEWARHQLRSDRPDSV